MKSVTNLPLIHLSVDFGDWKATVNTNLQTLQGLWGQQDTLLVWIPTQFPPFQGWKLAFEKGNKQPN